MAVVNSKIEWTDSTWSPTTGCTKVSPGCARCYAETLHERFHGKGSFATLTLHEDRLTLPLHWRKPRRIFVNSMSDLFHKDVPDEFIVEVFAVMAVAERHTFQVLTKRHARMRAVLSSPDFREQVARAAGRLMEDGDTWCDYVMLGPNWPLPNVWLGVSVENQQWADTRIPALLDTPAAVRWISAEPMLGPVDLHARDDGLHHWLPDFGPEYDDGSGEPVCQAHGISHCWQGCSFLDWVVVGGESGPGARPMQLQWALDIQRQCSEASAAYFFKQTGTVLARELGLKGKGDDPEAWPEPWPQQYPR